MLLGELCQNPPTNCWSTPQQTDEEVGTEVPVNEQSRINYLVEPKIKSSEKLTKSDKPTDTTEENGSKPMKKSTENNPIRKTKKKSENEDGTEKLSIDKILTHSINFSQKYIHTKYGESLYHVRWYGCKQKEDPSENNAHLPRSNISTYVNIRKLEIPKNVDEAVVH